jgi:hypothetical protein
MSTGDFIDDDPDIGAAVQTILAKGAGALGDGPEREDARENRTDREPHEQAEDADMDDQGAESVEAKGKEASDEGASEEQFLEIPGETEDAEPVKIPLSEAADAVKQLRQMNGDIAAAVIKAETEAQSRQAQITAAIVQRYEAVQAQAAAAYRAMQMYLPKPPDENLRFSDPQGYYDQKLYYDEYQGHMQAIAATVGQAMQAQTGVTGEQNQALIARETQRAARYIPEFGDDAKRDAKKAEITDVLAKRYGITKADMDESYDHRFWRMARDLAGYVNAEAKAPEVKKAVQEKAAKITNGKLPPREQGSGRFVSQDREVLRKSGSVDDAARLFMRSGLTKGL